VLAAVASAQDFSNMEVQRVVKDLHFAEGPVWSYEGFLLFSDVPNNHIRKLTPGERSVVFREDSHGANGNTFDAHRVLLTTGRLELAPKFTQLADADASYLWAIRLDANGVSFAAGGAPAGRPEDFLAGGDFFFMKGREGNGEITKNAAAKH